MCNCHDKDEAVQLLKAFIGYKWFVILCNKRTYIMESTKIIRLSEITPIMVRKVPTYRRNYFRLHSKVKTVQVNICHLIGLKIYIKSMPFCRCSDSCHSTFSWMSEEAEKPPKFYAPSNYYSPLHHQFLFYCKEQMHYHRTWKVCKYWRWYLQLL